MASFNVGSIRNLTLKRNSDGFGFSLSQRFPCCVISAVRKGGEAERAGLKTGDRLISIQGVDVTKTTRAIIADIIFRSGDRLSLTVAIADGDNDSMDVINSNSFLTNECTGLKINDHINHVDPVKDGTDDNFKQRLIDENENTFHRSNHLPCYRMSKFTNDDATKFQKRAVAISRSLSEPSNGILKPKISLVRNKPNETTNSVLNHNDRTVEKEVLLKSVVAYLGAVPVSEMKMSRQRILRRALESLQAQRIRIRTVLLEVFTFGIVVTNSKGSVINRFHTENVLFVIAYAKNKQFFAIGAVHDSSRISNFSEKIDVSVKSTADLEMEPICHVFAVDPELHLHTFHHSYAQKFKFKCTKDSTTSFCSEFPYVSTSIVYVTNALMLKASPSLKPYSPHFCRTCHGYTSSNSDSGFGNGNEEYNKYSEELKRAEDQCYNTDGHSMLNKLPTRKSSFNEIFKINSKRNPKNLKVTFSSTNSSAFETTADVHYDCSIIPSNLVKMHIKGYSALKVQESAANKRAARECLLSTTRSDVAEPGAGATSSTIAPPTSAESSLTRRLDSPQFCCRASCAATVESSGGIGAGFNNGKKAQSQQDLTVESPVYTNDQSKQLLKRCLLKKNQNFTSSNSATDIRRIAEDDDDNLGGDKNFSLTRFESSSPLGDCHYDAVVKQNNSLLRRLTRSETRSSFRMKQARKERLEIWGNDFDKLLKDPAGLYAFSEFLRKQYSQENINFWVACENFKVCDECQRNKVALELYEKYFASGCTEPVNVDSMVRQNIRDTVAAQNFSAAMYNQAQYQIFHLMKYDCYPRFLKSEDYLHCWDIVEKGHCLPEMKEPFLKSGDSGSSWFSSLGKSGGKEKESKDDKKKKLQLPWKPKFTTGKKAKDDSLEHSSSNDEETTKFLSNFGTKRKQGWRSGKQYSTPSEALHHIQRASPNLAVATLRNDVPSTSSCPPDVVPQPDPPSTPSPGLPRNCLESASCSTQSSCTVILPNCDKVTIMLRNDITVKQWLQDVARRYGLNYLATDAIDVENEDAFNQTLNSARALNGRTIRLETQVLFKLDIPSNDDSRQRKLLLVKSRSENTASQILRPILNNYGLKLDTMVITVAYSNEVLPNHSSIAQANNKRLMVLTQDEFQEWVHRDHDGGSPSSTCSNQTQFISSPLLDDSNNEKSFRQLPGHKGLSVLEIPQDCDSKKAFSGSKGGGMLKFVKKSIETKNVDQRCSPTRSAKPFPTKSNTPRSTPLTPEELVERSREEKKLVELLGRAQASSFDDQRGSSIKHVELPDFLKEDSNSQAVSVDDIILNTQFSRPASKQSRPTDMVHRKLCPINTNIDADHNHENSSPVDDELESSSSNVSIPGLSNKHLNVQTAHHFARTMSDTSKQVNVLECEGFRGGVKSVGSTPTNPVIRFPEVCSSSAVSQTSTETPVSQKQSRSQLQKSATSDDYTLTSGDLKEFVDKRRGLYVKDEDWQVDYV